MLVVNDQIQIPDQEIQFSFARGSGPGGQNVNKLNTKVTLRWNVYKSPSLPDHVKSRLIRMIQSRLTKEGDLIITSHRSREQRSNIDDCLERLKAMVLQATRQPKTRVATRPTHGSKRRRLADKKMNSSRKQMRRPPSSDD